MQVCSLRLDLEQFTLEGPVVDDFADVVDGVVRNLHSIVGQVTGLLSLVHFVQYSPATVSESYGFQVLP